MANYSFPITIVSIGIAFIYFSTVFIFINRWFGLGSSPGLMNAVIYTALAVMCVYNYALAVFTDPGRVPSNFQPDIEDSSSSVHEVKRKGGDLRYCQKCSQYKPPRTHHCRICRRCVLKMDHHCTWINNCVGLANYKIFFVFVTYAVIACIYSLLLLLGSLTIVPHRNEQKIEGLLQAIYVICFLLLVAITVALSYLWSWHLQLILRNQTTIEQLEGVRALWLADKGGDVYIHPYNIGSYENLISVLGPNVMCWLCPTSGHVGSGLHFRTTYDKATSA